MLDIGWQELMVVGVLALLVVGPKELPGLLRTVGQWAGKARSVARDFQRSMEDAAREADITEFQQIKDVKRDFEKMARVDFSEQAKKAQSFITDPKPVKSAPLPDAAPAVTPTEPATASADPAPVSKSEPAPQPAPASSASEPAPTDPKP
jgi:sec-independent protein translocase protein TatB